MSVIETRACSKCKEEKPLERFSKDKQRPDGIYPQCKDCRAGYYATNSSLILAKNQEYREKNRLRVREWNKRYGVRRFFWKVSANLKIRANGPYANHKELAALWKLQRGVCQLSGRRLSRETAQIDHIIPHIRGGANTVDNLRWVHRDVNYAKRDLFDAEFIALCQEVTLANLK